MHSDVMNSVVFLHLCCNAQRLAWHALLNARFPIQPAPLRSIQLTNTVTTCSERLVGVKPFKTGARVTMAQPIATRRSIACDAASLQFIKGVDEPSVPEVRQRAKRAFSLLVVMAMRFSVTWTHHEISLFLARQAAGQPWGRVAR